MAQTVPPALTDPDDRPVDAAARAAWIALTKNGPPAMRRYLPLAVTLTLVTAFLLYAVISLILHPV